METDNSFEDTVELIDRNEISVPRTHRTSKYNKFKDVASLLFKLIDRNGKILVLKSIKSRKRMKILSKLGMN
jgi:ribosomal protein S24E